MVNVLNILPNAVGQNQAPIIYAEVSSQQPAPQAFTDPLYVVMPDWSEDFYFTITDWPAVHGSTLPAAGAACVLLRDPRDNLRCVWWDNAVTAFSPTGTAGGDLSGTFPNPTVAKVSGTTIPLTGSAWIAPSLGTNWSNFGGSETTAGYLNDPLGFVHIHGTIKKSVAWAVLETVFTLPAGYRPGATEHFMGWLWDATNAFLTATWQISSAGAVTLDATPRPGTPGIVNAATLSGITFLAEN